jgi:MOSC domain-containing protein YiiM
MASPESSARVEAIWIAPVRRRPLVPVTTIRAVPGRGLEGDRYFLGRGSLSRWPSAARAISFIERETLDSLLGEHGIDLRDGRSRRNVETSGVVLGELKGRRFRIGTVLFRGAQLCQPCAYLERLTAAGAFAALKGRGGLRAEVLEEGIITVGDAVEVVGD